MGHCPSLPCRGSKCLTFQRVAGAFRGPRRLETGPHARTVNNSCHPRLAPHLLVTRGSRLILMWSFRASCFWRGKLLFVLSGKQQVPPLRRRIRSSCGRNDREFDGFSPPRPTVVEAVQE